jgi:hypothetical protein
MNSLVQSQKSIYTKGILLRKEMFILNKMMDIVTIVDNREVCVK